MAESSSYLAGATPTYTITHEDGSAVTPQEMYDAFMSGTVILEEPGDRYGVMKTVLDIEYTGTQDNVTGCIVRTGGGSITLGVM